MIEGEIIICLPELADKIKLVSIDSIRKFTFVGLPYVEIKGEWFAVLPVNEEESKNLK